MSIRIWILLSATIGHVVKPGQRDGAFALSVTAALTGSETASVGAMGSPHLIIAETASATWHYHLREVKNNLFYLGGGAPPALCGAKLGWDTQIPMHAWGLVSDHIPSSWCQKCAAARGEHEGVKP